MDWGEFDTVDWRRSSLCDGGSCVEVAFTPDEMIAVRDSGDPDAAVTFGHGEWLNFVARVKGGAFQFD